MILRALLLLAAMPLALATQRPPSSPKVPPYQVEFTLRRSYPPQYVADVDTLSGFKLVKIEERTYRFVTSDARELARLLDAIEVIVLR